MNSATAGAAFDGVATTDRPEDQILIRKMMWRLIPILFAAYVLNYLDRTNVGFAQLQMKDQLAFSDAVFGLGASMLFIGYALFEVPSNMMLARVGLRVTLLRIMVLWGATSTAMMFVQTPTQYYVLRFLLGAFEAGFAPGVLFYFTLWFPVRYRAQVSALFFMAVGATPILAGPLAGATMTYLDGALGLHGWQWLFIVEGVPTILLGVVTYFYLTDRPEKADWLTPTEKARVTTLLAQDVIRGRAAGAQESTFGDAFKDFRVWLVGLIAFLTLMGVYALAYWQPTMLKGMGLSVLQVGMYSAIPAVVGVIGSILLSRRSDRFRERRWHFSLAIVVASIGMLTTTQFITNANFAIACLSLATLGISGGYAILWAVPGNFLKGRAAASGLALVSTIAACAGMVAPLAVGLIRAATGSFLPSLYVLTGALLLAALLMAFVMPKSAVNPISNP